MGKIALSLKIDVSKIDKSRLFAGQKGTYLDATIFVDMDQLDQYGNSGMITQDVSKEEKAQKVQGNVLGNGKVFWVENGQAPQAQGQPQYQQPQGGFVQQQAPPQQQKPIGSFQQQHPNNGQQTPPHAMDFDDTIPF